MLTGEPYAGDPHVRFGGGSDANQCAVPTPIRGGVDTGLCHALTGLKYVLGLFPWRCPGLVCIALSGQGGHRVPGREWRNALMRECLNALMVEAREGKGGTEVG